ncbi:MAG: hypothetical protein MUC28_04225, partial [Planctomycetes bacterium]|nr:hypothetical protein [Planctomycetota bacterium]
MISVIEDGGTLVPENADQLREFLKNDFFIHYVGMLMPPRPGVGECVSLLEHTHYKPGTPRNELFIMRIVNWAAMVWTIVSIPIREKSFMEKIVDECGLRIAKGVPTLFSHEGFERFPADNERVFTLENKAGHPV